MQLVPTNGPVFELTVRLACAVQLSVAEDPVKARNPAIVVAAAGRFVLHSSSVGVGAVATGFVLSDTLNT